MNSEKLVIFPSPMHFPVQGQWWSNPTTQMSQSLQWTVPDLRGIPHGLQLSW